MQDDKSGSIYNLPAEKLLGLGSYKQTAHEVEIVEMLEICSLLENFAKTNIIGIVPDDIITVDTNLSDTLKAQFDNFIQETLKELKRAGINSIQNQHLTSLEEIIDSYANPTAQRDLQHLK
jgi:hydrogenase maturation protease